MIYFEPKQFSRRNFLKSTPLRVLSIFAHRLLSSLFKIAFLSISIKDRKQSEWEGNKERRMGRFTFSITYLQMKND